MISVTPVILCGGSGTRLWPLSRNSFPKQFLSLTGDESLFQQAARRMAALGDAAIEVSAPYLVSNQEYRFLAVEQLREVGVEPKLTLLEPVSRNTAPALTLAALAAKEEGDPILVVIPADQAIADQAGFIQVMRRAIAEAAKGAIVILGIKPDRPETSYGYIKVSSPPQPSQPADVEGFVEKPDAPTAQRYLNQGGYYWNAGMFVLRASLWLKALTMFRPEMAQTMATAWAQREVDRIKANSVETDRAATVSSTGQPHQSRVFVRPGAKAFAACVSESVDYAVMEHCPGGIFPLKMLGLDVGWSDLGAWDAVWQALPRDATGNAARGDVLRVDCRNTLVHASHRLVSLVGVKDVIVVETADAVLVLDKSRSQDVKSIVNTLQEQARDEHLLHRKVYRHWGWLDSIDEGERFRVNRIQIKPGAQMSLQKHIHRAEHWVVVRGTAEVRCGDKTFLLSENQSTYIPLGAVHQLVNNGAIPVEIIEVQSGSYLGEDDILRIPELMQTTRG